MQSPIYASIARGALGSHNGPAIFTIVLGVGLMMMTVERLAPGRNWPRVRGWWWRAILLNGVQVSAVLTAGIWWNAWMHGHRPWTLEALGPVKGGLLGYFVLTFAYYWWHRWRHKSDFLWRWVHQVHHSPQRLEVITSFYKHPIEIILNTLLSAVVLYLVLGLGTASASFAVLISGVAELVYHWNIATPHWLGYFFQRPESHCVHHEEGLHSYNYSDLPLWDWLFNTLDNPGEWRSRCGFGSREHRLAEMLVGVDVNRAEPGAVLIDKRAVALLMIGLAQMTGGVLGIKSVSALGAAIGASPAPRVFCSVDGLETFSSTFMVEWTDHARHAHTCMLTPALYARVRGPYNRRNVYGAVLADGPILEKNPWTRRMYEPVVRYSLCGDAPMLREIGINDVTRNSARVVLIPRSGTPFGDHPFLITPSCG